MTRLALLLAALLTGPAQAQTAPSQTAPSQTAPSQTAPAQTAPAQAAPAQTPEPSLDQMLGALQVAPDEQTARQLENAIKSRWQGAASPAVKLLLSRAMRELGENAPGDAVDSFDAALDLSPDLLEGWRGRALARAQMGDTAGAVRDLQEAVRREPRDFAAFQELSHIAEAKGDLDGAILAWRKVLELDPRSPDGAARLRALQRLQLGQGA